MGEDAPQTKRIPPDVAALYKPLWQQIAWLFAKWGTYIRLFGTSQDDLAVLNNAVGSFIALLQNIMIGDLIISISRLTDAKGSGQRKNLSLEALGASIDATVHATLAAEITAHIAGAHKLATFAREWRNRQVAHLDLQTSLGTHADPLSPYTRGQVQKALDAIAATLNLVSQHFDGSTTFFSDVIHGPGDADALIARLRDGLALRDWRLSEKRFGRSGSFPPEV